MAMRSGLMLVGCVCVALALAACPRAQAQDDYQWLFNGTQEEGKCAGEVCLSHFGDDA